MKHPRPPHRSASESRGVVFRWDLDKTYLQSQFESFRELVKIPFERPEDKVSLPGVTPLIRALKRVATEQGREARIFFLSASPPQIGRAIEDKLVLDGVEYDGITFKNQLRNLRRGRFRNLREQVGYKLTELLRARHGFSPEVTEVLFGDDWESDPIIYALYGDLLAGRVDPIRLREILTPAGVDPELVSEAADLLQGLPPADPVERIFIHLERRTPPGTFEAFGGRVVPTFNYFQTACCLFEHGHLDLGAVAEVARTLQQDHALTPTGLGNSLADLRRRHALGDDSARTIASQLDAEKLLPSTSAQPSDSVSWWKRWRPRRRSSPSRPPAAEAAPIDYPSLLRHWRHRDGAPHG